MKRVFMVCLLVATSASAQVARVFLAGTGNDAGDCTNQATPCRSLHQHNLGTGNNRVAANSNSSTFSGPVVPLQ